MDPNAALERIRQIVERALRDANSLESDGLDEEDEKALRYSMRLDAEELADHFHGLDEWLTNGGFLPKAWERK